MRAGGALAVLALAASAVLAGTPADAVPPAPPPDAPPGAATTYQINALHDGNVATPITPPLQEIWSTDLGYFVSHPLIVDGRVFVVTSNPTTSYGSKLWALDQEDGSILWGPLPISGSSFSSGIAADGAFVYSINRDGLLRAFDQVTGTLAWSRTLSGQTSFTAVPTVRDGVIYIVGGGSGGTMYAVDATTTEVLWAAPLAKSGRSSPAVTEDAAYVTYSCGVAYRIDIATGARVWARTTPCFGGGGGPTPVVHDGKVYARDSSYGAVLDAATGAVLAPFDSTLIPAISGTTAFLVRGQTVTAADTVTGEELWTQHADLDVSTAPLVLGDVIAVGSTSGTVYLLDTGTGVEVWSADAGSPIAGGESTTKVLPGLGAADGMLIVPATNRLVAYADRRPPSSAALAATPSPSGFREPVELTATITPATATGTVSFLIDGAHLPLAGCGAVPIETPGGVASCTTTAMPEGSHQIVARYRGDDVAGAASASIAHVVNPAPDGGSISGTVIGRGTDEVEVFALDPITWDVVGQGTVRDDGTYTIADLPGGELVTFFGASHAFGGPSSRSDEVWSAQHDLDLATTVDVLGVPVTGIDASLQPAGRIVGTVASVAGPEPGALVVVIPDEDTATQGGLWFALTDDAGAFSIPGLDIGAYEVLVDRDLDGSVDASSDAPIAVGAGATVDAGTFTVAVPSGVPSEPMDLSTVAGVGTVALTWGLPTSIGASPIDYVALAMLPAPLALDVGDDDLHAAATGVVNGVPVHIAVAWGNAHGTGPASVAAVEATGCAYLRFTDVTVASAFCPAIRWLVAAGIADGFDDATFQPLAGVSRQAMAAFLYRFAGSPDGPEPACTAAQFPDVPSSHPFCGEIAWLVAEGITTGYADGAFHGAAPVSRQSMAAFLYRFAGEPGGPEPACTVASSLEVTDIASSHRFCGEISWLVDAQIATGYGDGTFRPTATVSRQAMAAFLRRLDAVGVAAGGAGGAGGASSAGDDRGGAAPLLPLRSDPGSAARQRPVTVRVPIR